MIFNARRIAVISALCLLAAAPSASAAAIAGSGMTGTATTSRAMVGTAHAQRRTLGATTLTQFKTVLVVIREPSVSGGIPLATVTATGYERSSSGWKLLSAKIIGEAKQWFWYSVEVCSLTAAQYTTSSSGMTDPAAEVQVSLLATPAIGCTKTYTETWKP